MAGFFLAARGFLANLAAPSSSQTSLPTLFGTLSALTLVVTSFLVFFVVSCPVASIMADSVADSGSGEDFAWLTDYNNSAVEHYSARLTNFNNSDNVEVTDEVAVEDSNVPLADIDSATTSSSAPDTPSAPDDSAPDASYSSNVLFASSQVDIASLLNDSDVATFDSIGSQLVMPGIYQPRPHILAQEPEPSSVSSSLYSRLTSPRFRSAAEAKAHRRLARVKAKSEANDIIRVKSFGRDYWVCRIYNAMICTQQITDSQASTNRTRFTRNKVFDESELEAAAHHVFDEAIAVHERGWTRPKVYHKHTVRGKSVDKSENSVEMRLSRICALLQHTKSAVDDVMRGGLTLALLCDNPEARWHTKVSNDVGNAKRGARLKQTSTPKKTPKKAQQVPREEEEDVKGNEQHGSQLVGGEQDEFQFVGSEQDGVQLEVGEQDPFEFVDFTACGDSE
ncbi:hypothetical protein B5807_08079 [Epicoccum nigrum]|uniref:Uncharacterized protein n=1 Tax=Epicoccum nigrum TaxID=105696 RepID=A0A1Y2LRT5_EPING|nr:hypothetical protein B5807_08079 [Epicoccum nigrum]